MSQKSSEASSDDAQKINSARDVRESNSANTTDNAISEKILPEKDLSEQLEQASETTSSKAAAINSTTKLPNTLGDMLTQHKSLFVQGTVLKERNIKALEDSLNDKQSKLLVPENCDNDNAIEEHDENESENMPCELKRSSSSRKEKSLGLLCQRFVLATLKVVYSEHHTIHLESVARQMNVEKRRIYDIVNVMEALEAMEKANKSNYHWRGLDNLPSVLYRFKAQATEENLPEKVRQTQEKMTRFVELPDGGRQAPAIVGTLRKPQVSDDNGNSLRKEIHQKTSRIDGYQRNQRSQSIRGGHNSLAHLCKRFMMILISGPNDETSYKVSLDVASTMLIKNPEVDGYDPPSRSRCRRLYDVANVLVALRLVQKRLYNFGTKKIPLYVYCGPRPSETDKFNFVEHLISHKLSTETEDKVEAQAIAKEEALLLDFVRSRDAALIDENTSQDRVEPENKRRRTDGTKQMVNDKMSENEVTKIHEQINNVPKQITGNSGEIETSDQIFQTQTTSANVMNFESNTTTVHSSGLTIAESSIVGTNVNGNHMVHAPQLIVSQLNIPQQPSSSFHISTSTVTSLQQNIPQYMPSSSNMQAFPQIDLMRNYSFSNQTPVVVPFSYLQYLMPHPRVDGIVMGVQPSAPFTQQLIHPQMSTVMGNMGGNNIITDNARAGTAATSAEAINSIRLFCSPSSQEPSWNTASQ